MEISSLRLLTILDSRTRNTIQAKINGSSGKAPSGASTGEHEAACFVPENLSEVQEEMSDELVGENLSQEEFDEKLKQIDDGHKFENIGAVGIASSFAFKRADGYEHGNKFPYPLSNVVGGGEHGGNTSIQEFLVIPVEAESFPEAVEINATIYQELKETHAQKIQGMNDEGALVTSMDDEKTLRAVKQVADKHGARLGLDIAASEFYEDGKYKLISMGMDSTPEEHLKFVQMLIDKFDLLYVEDPFDENDFEMHKELTKNNPEVLICGDDLFTTDPERLQKGVDMDSCNSLIVKPNQIGTVSDAAETVGIAHENDYIPCISHRSGETCDASISDLALEWECPVIKAGIADIRIAKLNRLLDLWDRAENPEMNKLV